MKYALAGLLMLGTMAGVSAQAGEVAPPATVTTEATAPALQKVDCGPWGCWHNRWRSHWRWGSHGGWGGHNRWRSHHRWGSWHNY
jgi:hypothetical protein